MKHFVILLICITCSTAAADAQTYLDHLRQKNKGQGTVTVIQSKEIDELVNGSRIKVNQDVKAGEKPNTKKTEEPPTVGTDKKADLKEENHTTEKPHEKDAPILPRKTEEKEGETELATIDMRKKVMRKSYKVTGYRVQAFAGGNTRADRQKAESIRTAIKMKFPDQPVYVHFYSPRWICRVGNYRSYEQASWMLKEIQKMGYKAATIVRGKITVQY
ncbi:SPOR domain-containing protein [Prevotella sp. KH2C16]|uniref:SPOR domain-containing protein n=1 Tax=Prevotella sp. KH2C16 TaxID=1855325 RepID=UPI0008F11AD0|nr:SPOR domain-containing protein [Prevotella sp. KH2C16]SFG26363.1 hypothetical protein SAMN05216383_10872 [Prevotella sp. KH2C16]